MIKSFIYLDEQKMYSLSSQIFEGITEYVLREDGTDSEKTETQKGPVASGKILGDAIKKSSRSTEKKFIHDYAFTVFERYLEQEGRIVELPGTNLGLTLQDTMGLVGGKSFVKIRAKAVFNDYAMLAEMLANFNTLGKSIAYAGVYQQLQAAKKNFDEVKAGVSDKNQRAKIEREYKRVTDVSRMAKDEGLYQDPEMLKSVAFLIKHGFQDQFEIKQSLGGAIFTSCLKRGLLRDKEELLIKKYSRITEREVVVFGLVSQAFSVDAPVGDSASDYFNMKSALMSLVEHLADAEKTISGKQDNEVVIDPVAAYFEV